MDTFFTLSKLFWMLAAPSNLLVMLAVLGLVFLFAGSRRIAPLMLAVAIGGLVILGFSPLANYLLSPLEERFPPFVDDGRPVAGIIQLGGAEVPDVALARGVPALNDAGERMIAFAELARRYPDARLVFSGGTGSLAPDAVAEADAVRQTLKDLGMDLGRVTFEGRSRNTAENARNTRALVEPKPGERWLLVTSAFHMPRAVGTFRAVGFPVTAYPVDYRTVGPGALAGTFSRAATGLDFTDGATKEWIGLISYYLTGRTSALLPAP